MVLAILTLVLTGCATEGPRHQDVALKSGSIERRCGSALSRHAELPGIEGAAKPSAQEPPPSLSERAWRIAEDIGASGLLRQLVGEDRGDRSQQDVLHRLSVQQQLSNRILLAFLDVARTAAEADCEEERADQLADRLQEARDKRIRHQTLIAIVGDAMIGIVSGGLSLALQETASAATAILGGSVATTFGLAAFFDGSSYEFQHPRNILAEVWEGPAEPALIPPSVWRHLNRPMSDDSPQTSLRATIIERWREDGRFGEPGSNTEARRMALFFGPGGSYEIEDLRARAAMLDLLEADVNLMSQDLEQLMQEVLLASASTGMFRPSTSLANASLASP